MKDLEELIELRNKLVQKMTTLTQLFPGGVPTAPEIEFTPKQNKAIKDVDRAWKNFRQKARTLGALVD